MVFKKKKQKPKPEQPRSYYGGLALHYMLNNKQEGTPQ
jgi:hypothetical protein